MVKPKNTYLSHSLMFFKNLKRRKLAKLATAKRIGRSSPILAYLSISLVTGGWGGWVATLDESCG